MSKPPKFYPKSVLFVTRYGMAGVPLRRRFRLCLYLLMGYTLTDVDMVFSRQEIEAAIRLLNTPIVTDTDAPAVVR